MLTMLYQMSQVKKQALNGEAKLNAAKQEANTALGQLNNLNNAQR